MKRIQRKIVAIGGGDLNDRRYHDILREVMRLTGRKHPRVLIIPTASSDTRDYDRIVHKVLEGKLGCRIDHLYLVSEEPEYAEIAGKICAADIVFVPGGNTLKMMRLWRRLGVDKLLKQAWKRGVVLSGVSAGAICWFDGGHSDSLSFYNQKNWKYIRVAGMGLAKGIVCPHFSGETAGKKRRQAFAEMMRGLNEIGIALDNNCAIEFVDQSFRVISTQKGANAYRVYKKSRAVISEVIAAQKELQPVERLYVGS